MPDLSDRYRIDFGISVIQNNGHRLTGFVSIALQINRLKNAL